jgi:hypothetical protein
VKSGSSVAGSAFYDSVNGRLNFVYAGDTGSNTALSYRAVTTNVTTGTPGALSTEVVIDAGGANLGVRRPYAFHSPTASNARYWIIAAKFTALNTIETRAWNVDIDTVAAADTAGNWVTTNFTNLGSNSGTIEPKQGIGGYWTVSAVDKVTLVFRNDGGGGPQAWESVTFDPTAATPTPGTITAVTPALNSQVSSTEGALCAFNAKADYLVFGLLDSADNTWDFFKTVNGTSWANPSGWTGLTMGRCQITLSGSDFYLIHSESYGVLATSAQALKYRKITTASDNMGGVTAFSDTNGNAVAVPLSTGASKLYGLYRASTASPYSLRSDFVNLGGGADTTAPSQAAVTATGVTSTTVSLSAVMPSDADVSEYEVRYLTGGTAPATNRTNGTISTAATATSASATVTPSITGLTASTRITGRVFVKDTTGNWNTGATFTAVPVTSPAFVGRFRSDGVTAVATATDPLCDILVWQLVATDFETGGANAHMRARVGTDAVTPPTVSIYEIVSTSATAWQYKDQNSVWTNWPSAGLTSFDWARQIRLVNNTTQTSQFVSIRIEQ